MKRGERKGRGMQAVMLCAMAAATLSLLAGCFTLTVPAVPKVGGSRVVAGLDGPVEVHRDRDGVAHVIASSDRDVFFAQGYVHAQERFYQMEFWRRIGAGRLSELFGRSTLASDIYLRTMGFRRVVEREYAAAPPLLKLALDAYAAGVNAYIAGRKPGKLAAELGLLALQGVDFTIEPWTPLDSLTWPKVMSLDMGVDYQEELLRLDMVRAVGIDMTKDYFAPYRYDELPTTLRREEVTARGGMEISTMARAASPQDDLALLDEPAWRAAVDALDLTSRVFEGQRQLVDLAFNGDPTSGSNQWVVAGRFTPGGKPVLANDPHLGMQMPSIWYEMSLHVTGGSGWNCHGYSFAGMPGIVIGHNDRIAWGMSTASPDVQDLFVEQVNPLNPDEYRVADRWVVMEKRQEVIRVKKADPCFITVRSTRNGPIVTDHGGEVAYASYDVRPVQMFPDDLQLTELAMRWTALEPSFPIHAVLLYDRAANFAEFREALSHFHAPSHNFLYADVEGNIGYVHPGRIPVRGKGSGSLPNPGWDDAYQWQGYLPYDRLPWLLNPPRGWLTNENNAVMPDGMQVFGEHLYAVGFRAYRAETLLAAAMADGTVTREEHGAIQQDTRNEFAARLLPSLLDLTSEAIARSVERETRLLAAPADNEEEEKELAQRIERGIRAAESARGILGDWDLLMHEESVGATVFAQFYLELIDRTYTDQVPLHVWEGPWEPWTGYRLENSLWLLAGDPDNPWWDDVRTLDLRESRDDIIARALAGAFAELEEKLGKDPQRWKWGRLHTLTYTNATLGKSGIGFVEKLFNRGPRPVSGGLDVLLRNDFKLPTAFAVTHVCSMRMIVDTADWSASLWINSPGQSGHPASPHYDDAFDEYREGKYFSHPWTLEEIRERSRDRLVLQPPP